MRSARFLSELWEFFEGRCFPKFFSRKEF